MLHFNPHRIGVLLAWLLLFTVGPAIILGWASGQLWGVITFSVIVLGAIFIATLFVSGVLSVDDE